MNQIQCPEQLQVFNRILPSVRTFLSPTVCYKLEREDPQILYCQSYSFLLFPRAFLRLIEPLPQGRDHLTEPKEI